MNYHSHQSSDDEYLIYSDAAEKDIIYVYFDSDKSAVEVTHIELSDVVVRAHCCRSVNAISLREEKNTIVVDVDTIYDSVMTETAYFC